MRRALTCFKEQAPLVFGEHLDTRRRPSLHRNSARNDLHLRTVPANEIPRQELHLVPDSEVGVMHFSVRDVPKDRHSISAGAAAGSRAFRRKFPGFSFFKQSLSLVIAFSERVSACEPELTKQAVSVIAQLASKRKAARSSRWFIRRTKLQRQLIKTFMRLNNLFHVVICIYDACCDKIFAIRTHREKRKVCGQSVIAISSFYTSQSGHSWILTFPCCCNPSVRYIRRDAQWIALSRQEKRSVSLPTKR